MAKLLHYGLAHLHPCFLGGAEPVNHAVAQSLGDNLWQVPCTTEAEPRRSVFRTQDVAPIVLKQAALLAEKLGLVGFSTVDSTIAALEGGLPKDPACPNSQCMVTETHLKQAYATEAQVTHLANTASILTAYLDGILQEAPLPEPVAVKERRHIPKNNIDGHL
ncbi:UNVERIFIED_CONTAM: hypothetical protein FKN15_013110 [Acipenser sinensis]